MEDNPLLSPQREKSGPTTFAKYGYQYHWALYKVLEEHGETNEYAIFLELHEDVVLSNSLNKHDAKFEFNQVKTDKSKFTEHKLTRVYKNKPSILGKLLDSCIKKEYSDQIKNINLISANGFSLSLKKPDLDFEVIQISDLADSSFEDIEKKLITEIKCEGLPDN